MENLSEDVLTNILSRVPAMSVSQLKITCKLWYALISHPRFAKLQLEQSLRKNAASYQRILKTNPTQSIGFEFFEDNAAGNGILNLHDPLGHLQGVEPTIAASCDGLVCLVHYVDGCDFISLWNPSTGELRKLPQPGYNFPFRTFAARRLYGLGYDRETDDYKLLRLVSYRSLTRGSEIATSIFALKSNSWRNINHKPKGCVRIFSSETVYLHGALHWLSFHEPRSDHVYVVSFDFAKEEFVEVVPMPTVDQELIKFVGVRILDGRLVLQPRYWNNGLYEPWVMKEYGVEQSWDKLFTILPLGIPCSRDCLTMICSWNGMVIFYRDFCMVTYDMKKKTWKELDISIGNGVGFWCAVYVESFISPFPNKAATANLGAMA